VAALHVSMTFHVWNSSVRKLCIANHERRSASALYMVTPLLASADLLLAIDIECECDVAEFPAGTLVPLDDDDLNAAVGSDVPRGDRARETDDQRTEQRRPETGNDKVVQQRGNECEHCRIQNQHE